MQTKLRTIITSLYDNKHIIAKQRDVVGPDQPHPPTTISTSHPESTKTHRHGQFPLKFLTVDP